MRSLTLQQTGASDGSNRKPEWAARGVRWIGGALVILLHVPFPEEDPAKTPDKQGGSAGTSRL